MLLHFAAVARLTPSLPILKDEKWKFIRKKITMKHYSRAWSFILSSTFTLPADCFNCLFSIVYRVSHRESRQRSSLSLNMEHISACRNCLQDWVVKSFIRKKVLCFHSSSSAVWGRSLLLRWNFPKKSLEANFRNCCHHCAAALGYDNWKRRKHGEWKSFFNSFTLLREL